MKGPLFSRDRMSKITSRVVVFQDRLLDLPLMLHLPSYYPPGSPPHPAESEDPTRIRGLAQRGSSGALLRGYRGGPRRFTPGFTGPALLGCLPRGTSLSCTGLLPPTVRRSRAVPLATHLITLRWRWRTTKKIPQPREPDAPACAGANY
jgi:hypothetical protein